MTKEEVKMDLIMYLAELQVSHSPTFIDLTYDLWTFLRDARGWSDTELRNVTPPFSYLKVYLTSNGNDGEIYLSFAPKISMDRVTFKYNLPAEYKS